jgi:hypothetical protein
MTHVDLCIPILRYAHLSADAFIEDTILHDTCDSTLPLPKRYWWLIRVQTDHTGHQLSGKYQNRKKSTRSFCRRFVPWPRAPCRFPVVPHTLVQLKGCPMCRADHLLHQNKTQAKRVDPRRRRRGSTTHVNPDRGLNPGPTDIIAESDVEVCCATTALPGRFWWFRPQFAVYIKSHFRAVLERDEMWKLFYCRKATAHARAQCISRKTWHCSTR